MSDVSILFRTPPSIDVQSPESMLEKLLSKESDIGVGYFGSFPP
ncbi:hypothetical protein ACPESL_02280 [Psychrobacter pocilloporae]